MIPVREMQVTVDEVADVIPMRDRLVSAAGTMHMAGFVSRAFVRRCAPDRVHIAYFDDMFVHVSIVHVVQVAVMKVIDMVAMTNRRVAAAGSMVVVVIVMLWVCAFRHVSNSVPW
jgi:hypothetical protein